MPKLSKTPPQPRPLEVEPIGSASTQLPEEAMQLARQLCALHGSVRVAIENSGMHLYLASPAGLEEDGLIELTKKHLAVNVDKWLQGQEWCAMCMKTDTAYSVNDLVSMRSLEDRGYQDVPREVSVQTKVNEAFLEDDGRGHMIPKGPGNVVPIHTLAPDHPAQVYLHSRGFLAKDLRIQFRCDYCEEERSDVYYRRLDAGFKATPQGRIIFYIDVNGVNVGWQARVLELDVKDGQTYRWIFHPYTKEWVRVLRIVRDEVGKIVRLEPLPGHEGWELPKYIIGAGCRRNASLMGYDEAVRWNSRFRPRLPRVCVLAEGPLDAGRVGPPGIAMLGKFLSKDQAALLNARFDMVIFVADNDSAGQEAKKRVGAALSQYPGLALQILDVPEGVKDLGEMGRPEARALVQQVCPIWRSETAYVVSGRKRVFLGMGVDEGLLQRAGCG